MQPSHALKSRALRLLRSPYLWLSLITLAVYGNVLFNGFTVDDEFAYSSNGFIGSLRNLPALLDARYFQYSGEASYRPFCTLTYFVDRAIWKLGSVGPHLTQVTIFLATVLLLFALFQDLVRDRRAAFLGAALFAVHSLHSEVVNNIAFREDLLTVLFFPLSWLAFRAAGRRRPAVWLTLAWLAAFAAYLSKESAIVLPALAVVAFWLSRRTDPPLPATGRTPERRIAAAYFGGLVFVTLFFLLIRFRWMHFPGEAQVPRLGGSLAGTLLADVKIQARYLLLFLFPFPLRAYYPPLEFAPEPDMAFFLSLSGLLALGAALLWFHRCRWFLGAMLWWFVSLVPVANLHPIFNPMAERYVYLATVGPCLGLGVAMARALRSRFRFAALLLVSSCLFLMGLRTFMRRYDWRDNMAVWSTLARHYPEDPKVLSSLASAQFEAGDYGGAFTNSVLGLAAIKQSKATVGTVPLYLCLAGCWMLSGDYDTARQILLEAETRLPARNDLDFAVYRNLGIVHDEKNDLETALKYYDRAARLDPFRAEIWRKIAVCRLRLGATNEAVEAWTKAKSLTPDIPTFEQAKGLVEKATSP